MKLSSLLSCSRPKKHSIQLVLHCVISLYERLAIQTHVSISHVHCAVWQVHWDMHMIFCIEPIFRRPTSAKRNMPVCANMVCQQSGLKQMWAGSGQMYSFSSERERLSGVDCRGWLPHIPPVRWGEAEVERDMFGMERGGWGEGLSEADVTPLSSPCWNKSCSRSFYLHMLTGTSEFPEEKCGEKKMRRKKTEKETQGDGAHHCCKRLKWAFLEVWCNSDQTLYLRIHSFLFTLAQKERK